MKKLPKTSQFVACSFMKTTNYLSFWKTWNCWFLNYNLFFLQNNMINDLIFKIFKIFKIIINTITNDFYFIFQKT
jgi:hypothetical protein